MRKIKYARLHDLNVVVEGIGGITKELPMQGKTLPDLEMYVGEELGFLTVRIAGNRNFGIPLANVQFVVFESDDKHQDLRASREQKIKAVS